MRRWLLRAALLSLPCLTMGFDCGGGGAVTSIIPPPLVDGGPANTSWSDPKGRFGVAVTSSPFGFSIANSTGQVLLQSTTTHDATDPGSPVRAYAAVSMTHDDDLTKPYVMTGWDYFHGQDDPWNRGTAVASYESTAGALVVHVATDDTAHPAVTLRFAPDGDGLRITAQIDGATSDDPNTVMNRLSLGFQMHDDDHFLGFGARKVYSDHKGQLLYTWVEDKGFGMGEGTPIGPSNPFPHGPGETYMPIPWFMSPRGFGMLLHTTFRTQFHLGDETGATDAWRVESWQPPSPTAPAFDATLYADPDPKNLVASLTAVTGRPPAIADYVLAPRRRIDNDADSFKYRAAHIPTSVADLDTHYFPNGGGADTATIRARTADYHNRGFKVVAYFCPFVADSWHPVFDDAVAKGYLVKHADGTPYTVLDQPYNAGMVDFTNPDAVTWYQGFLQQALDDGWDGWMYDFAEYVPYDAVMFNGMTGQEAHNLYPVLYQKAAHDLLEQKRAGDYLIFVRSGYAGTGGLVPMMWAGDQSTDFDLADGLPSALQGALNVGMSGVPLWGSDISGYHYVYNPPPDKEEYLRWTELGAFSADMHDENNGTGNSPGSTRWQIWNDQESQDVYRTYATYKTRMLPYVKLAVAEARARGTPVMRHLFLEYPRDPNVVTIGDEYMYGDSLLVAPVVSRGLTARPVYLPEPSYFDFFSGARVAGGTTVMANAPLDDIPIYAKVGAIVPMLAADVETVAPDPDNSVTTMGDRVNFMEVQVFAGGTSAVTLDDGTVLSQSAPGTAFAPTAPTDSSGPIAMASAASELMTCASCAWDDPASNVYSISVVTAGDTITAGPLTLGISTSQVASPATKRYLFTVRH